MLSCRWCLCGLVWFLPLPCSKIWNCAQDNIRFWCVVLWFLTVYFKQLLMAKVLTGTSMMNIDHSNQCKQLYQKTWWLVHSPRTLCARKSWNHSKIKQKRSQKFKLCIHNVFVVWNIAFYMRIALRIMVKCTGTIFVSKWKSIR